MISLTLVWKRSRGAGQVPRVKQIRRILRGNDFGLDVHIEHKVIGSNVRAVPKFVDLPRSVIARIHIIITHKGNFFAH